MAPSVDLEMSAFDHKPCDLGAVSPQPNGAGARSVDGRVGQLVDHLRERVGTPVSMSELEHECERKGLDVGLLDRAIAHLGGRLAPRQRAQG
jgi:hypothetical protein